MEFIENDYFSKMPSRSKSRWAAPALSDFDGLESVPSQVVLDKDITDDEVIKTDDEVIKTDDGLPEMVALNTGPNDDPNNLTINENENEDKKDGSELFKKPEKTAEQIEIERQLKNEQPKRIGC